MGDHISDTQRNELIACYNNAITQANPKQAFIYEVNKRIGTVNGWWINKANHIINNLTSCFSEQIDNTPPPGNHALAQVKKIAQNGCVAFYKTGPTEFLGNFANAPITIWGKTFQCAEAAFQWQKYMLIAKDNKLTGLDNNQLMDKFFTANGEEAFKINRALESNYPKKYADNWKEGVRDKVMWEVLQAKFQQNPNMKALLQATGSAYLLEHNEAPRDDYWSDNLNGSGLNMLGQMLMAIRDNKPCPAVNNHDPRMLPYTQDVNKKIGANSLEYKIF